jgi:hypothetical protein
MQQRVRMKVRMKGIRSGWALVAVLFAGAACAGTRGNAAPDVTPGAWRALVGCYLMDGQRVELDTVPELRDGRLGARLARFAPRAINRSYWYVHQGSELWVIKDDGLSGTRYELRVKGDSLTGWRREWNEAPAQGRVPTAVTGVRTQSCPVATED